VTARILHWKQEGCKAGRTDQSFENGKNHAAGNCCSRKRAKEDTDFMPLSVEYKEKYASSGRIPGGFLKREAGLLTMNPDFTSC